MKILNISPCQGAFGGIEAFVLALSDYLHNSDYTVQVVFKKVENFSLKDSLQQAINQRSYPIDFVEKGDIKSLVRQIQNTDVVHCHNPLLEVIACSVWFKVPTLLTVYNWCRSNLDFRPIIWRLVKLYPSYILYISDFVWNSWDKIRSDNSGKLPIVSNFPSSITSIADRKGFVFASRWIKNKGLRTLLFAYSKSSIDDVAWPLYIMGDGPLRNEVEAIIRDNNITGVENLGFVSDEKRNSVISNSKWMITPPSTNEDLGLTTIEARSVKIPSIISRDGGLPEAAGMCCLSFEPGDLSHLTKLIELATMFSDDEYSYMSERSHELYCIYNKSLDEYCITYKRMIKEGSL